MSARNYFDGNYSGGKDSYPNRVTKKIFYGRCRPETIPGTIKSGQVLKAYTFLESDVNGKLIAHGGLVESATIDFGASITTGQTFIAAGLTFTAGSGSVTAIQLADIWSGLTVGDTAAVASAKILAKGYSATVIGTFTSGTLAGYSTTSVSSTRVRFDAIGTGAASATDVAITGTGAAAGTATITQYAAMNKIAGVTVYDVDATSSDTNAEVYSEASFWGDDDGTVALLWAVDPTVDTILNAAGTAQVAVTAYNTGCSGTSAASHLLKRKFIEGSEFELGFVGIGDRV